MLSAHFVFSVSFKKNVCVFLWIWAHLDFNIVQSRIVMPMSMEEVWCQKKQKNEASAFLRWIMNWPSSILVLQYEIGLSYTIMKMEQENTNSKEGVEVLQQVPFEDEKLGKGQLTSKVYHLQRFVFILILSSTSTCYSRYTWWPSQVFHG